MHQLRPVAAMYAINAGWRAAGKTAAMKAGFYNSEKRVDLSFSDRKRQTWQNTAQESQRTT